MGNQKIIIVDDDKGITGVLSDFLMAKDFDVEVYHSVEDARMPLMKMQHDLALLDWDMPGQSGIELCQEFRAKGGRTPVLMMTGHSDIEDKELGLESGADDYLTKPFSVRELYARIKSLLRRVETYTPPPVAKDPYQPEKGFLIQGKYRLEEPIGMGGMALVWRATDIAIERQVVVKLMHDHLLQNEEAQKRFEQECKLMARIKHPNVVTLYDAGTLNNSIPYLVMEHIEGKSLRELLETHGPAPVKATATIMSQICAGLQEAHNAGVVHRDLKPENILLQRRTDRTDAVKIVDFGIARFLSPSGERVTRDGMVIGTMEYISPEQLEDRIVDGRSDIYALGVMFFELLTNDLPFFARSIEGMMAKHLMATPMLPSVKRADIERGSLVDQIVHKCLEKKAEDRFQSADELRRAFEQLLI